MPVLSLLHTGRILGSHGGRYEDGCLVDTMLTASTIKAMMMEVISPSETSVSFYQTTQRNIQ
jgi:hypothetical protein